MTKLYHNSSLSNLTSSSSALSPPHTNSPPPPSLLHKGLMYTLIDLLMDGWSEGEALSFVY